LCIFSIINYAKKLYRKADKREGNMKKFFWVALILSVLLLASCGLNDGTIVLTNDRDLVVKTVYLQNLTYKGNKLETYSVNLQKGDKYTLKASEAEYIICTDAVDSGNNHLGTTIEVIKGEVTEVETSSMTYSVFFY